MSVQPSYLISLKACEHPEGTYLFELDDAFFAGLSEARIHQGRVSARLQLSRLGEAFAFNLHLQGVVMVPCDRCLDDMEQVVEGEARVVVEYGSSYQESEEKVVIPEEAEGYDVAWFMYETIALAVPYRHVHPEGKCNAEMQRILDEYSNQSSSSEAAIDPRWVGLKELIQSKK